MGYTKVKVKISNPREPSRSHQRELLVDAGAVYTVINGKALGEIGIEAIDKMEFRSISNEKLIRKIDVSEIEVRGRKWLTNIIFGENADNEVLGVTTLEQLGLQVDPVSKQIKPLPLYLL